MRESKSSESKSSGRFLFVLFASLLALLAAITLFALIGRVRAKVKANRQIAELQAANQPTSAWELNTYYDDLVAADTEAPPREVVNAWLSAIRLVASEDYRKATESLPILGSGTAPDMVDKSWPAAPATQAFLDRFESEIAQLHELAAQLGPLRYPNDFARTFESLPDHFSAVRAVARLFRFEAQVAAYRQDGASYVQAISGLLRVGDSLRLEPSGIALLVRLAVEATAAQTVQETVNEVALTAAQAQALAAAFDQRGSLQHLRLSLVGERAMAIPMFLNYGVYTRNAPSYVPARYGDLQYYLEITDRMIAACDQEWPEVWQGIHREQVALEAERTANSTLTNYLHVLSLLALPSIEAYAKATLREEFRRRACRCAFGLESFRADHQAYPAQLTELVPAYLAELPSDPYDGQPLRYRKTPDGYLIYSIGPDSRDDGGQMKRDRAEPDIVFQVPPPPEAE